MNKKKYIYVTSMIVLVIFAVIAFQFFKGQNTQNKKATTIQATPSLGLATPQAQILTPSPNNTTPVVNNPSNNSTVTTQHFKTETFKELSVTVDIPNNWEKNNNYDYRFEGSNGFIELTALSGFGLDFNEVIDTQINHTLKPYGDNPTIKKTTVDSQEAVIITPSSTQNTNNLHYAIIIKSPKPVTINSTPYYYLIVWSDKEHIENLSSQVKFIEK